MDVAASRAMPNAIRQKLVVDRAGVLEIRSPDLVAGAVAEVIVLLDAPEGGVPPLSSLIGKGKGLFATPEEADEYIRKEREAWDS